MYTRYTIMRCCIHGHINVCIADVTYTIFLVLHRSSQSLEQCCTNGADFVVSLEPGRRRSGSRRCHCLACVGAGSVRRRARPPPRRRPILKLLMELRQKETERETYNKRVASSLINWRLRNYAVTCQRRRREVTYVKCIYDILEVLASCWSDTFGVQTAS